MGSCRDRLARSRLYRKTLAVVVTVDEPAGDGGGFVATHFSVGDQTSTIDLHLNSVFWCIEDVDVRFAEDHEQIALASVL